MIVNATRGPVEVTGWVPPSRRRRRSVGEGEGEGLQGAQAVRTPRQSQMMGSMVKAHPAMNPWRKRLDAILVSCLGQAWSKWPSMWRPGVVMVMGLVCHHGGINVWEPTWTKSSSRSTVRRKASATSMTWWRLPKRYICWWKTIYRLWVTYWCKGWRLWRARSPKGGKWPHTKSSSRRPVQAWQRTWKGPMLQSKPCSWRRCRRMWRSGPAAGAAQPAWVTPPRERVEKPGAETASQGASCSSDSPEGSPPVRSPGGVKVEKGEKEKEEPVSGSKVVPKPTPKSPPRTGISSPSSQTAGGDKSPGEGSRKSPGEGSEKEEKKRSRTPLNRRPHGAKQRRKFAKGNYGDMRVKFADPIDNRGKDGKKGGEKGRSKGKGKGKGKSKSKKGQPSKGKNKGPRKASPSASKHGGDKSEWVARKGHCTWLGTPSAWWGPWWGRLRRWETCWGPAGRSGEVRGSRGDPFPCLYQRSVAMLWELFFQRKGQETRGTMTWWGEIRMRWPQGLQSTS